MRKGLTDCKSRSPSIRRDGFLRERKEQLNVRGGRGGQDGDAASAHTVTFDHRSCRLNHQQEQQPGPPKLASSSSVAGPSLAGYIRAVRRALRRRAGDYGEFASILVDLHRPVRAADSTTAAGKPAAGDAYSDDCTEKRIRQIERIICLLDGYPRLIEELNAFLPDEYVVDIQLDAVVIKVSESPGSYGMVQTGHGRPVSSPPSTGRQLLLLQETGEYRSAGVDASVSRRRRINRAAGNEARSSSCPPRRPSRRRGDVGVSSVRVPRGRSRQQQRTRSTSTTSKQSTRRQQTTSTTVDVTPSLDPAAMVTSSPSATAVAYVTDVRRTLAKRPDVYRQFVGVFRRRYDSDRNRLPNATELDDDKLADAVVDVVSLLRMHPRLVLGFNNFLPEGYRIKIRDSSSYVLEYSGGSGGGGKGDGVGSNAQRLVITI